MELQASGWSSLCLDFLTWKLALSCWGGGVRLLSPGHPAEVRILLVATGIWTWKSQGSPPKTKGRRLCQRAVSLRGEDTSREEQKEERTVNREAPPGPQTTQQGHSPQCSLGPRSRTPRVQAERPTAGAGCLTGLKAQWGCQVIKHQDQGGQGPTPLTETRAQLPAKAEPA